MRNRLTLTFATCTLLISLTGCELASIAQQFETAAESTQLLGVSGTTLILGDPRYPDGVLGDIVANPGAYTEETAPPKATFRIYSIDVASGEVKVLDEAAPQDEVYGAEDDVFFAGFGAATSRFGASAALSDGPWTAKVDYANGFVAVSNGATGVETHYLTEVGEDVYVSLAGLAHDRLLVRLEPPTSLDLVLVVIDLNSGDELVMDHVAPHSGAIAAFDGDRLAFRGLPEFDADTQSLDALGGGFTIDYVELATGERRTLATDLDGSTMSAIFFRENDVAWVENDYESGYALKVADIDTGAVQTLIRYSSSAEEGYPWLVGANAQGALFQAMIPGPPPASIFDLDSYTQTTHVFIERLDGQRVTLVEYTQNGLAIAPPLVNTLTDDYAVVLDPLLNELVVYELASGNTRRIALP